jgi:predicted nucleic acid-binding protein
VLIDTNVLVYAVDVAERDKSRRAAEVLARLSRSGRGYVSVQSIGEFVRVTTDARRRLLTLPEAVEQVDRLLRMWWMLDVTPPVAAMAVRAVRDRGVGYWDAQIWATARVNAIGSILTEDGPDDGVVDGVRYLNPFASGFDLTWLD